MIRNVSPQVRWELICLYLILIIIQEVTIQNKQTSQ